MCPNCHAVLSLAVSFTVCVLRRYHTSDSTNHRYRFFLLPNACKQRLTQFKCSPTSKMFWLCDVNHTRAHYFAKFLFGGKLSSRHKVQPSSRANSTLQMKGPKCNVNSFLSSCLLRSISASVDLVLIVNTSKPFAFIDSLRAAVEDAPSTVESGINDLRLDWNLTTGKNFGLFICLLNKCDWLIQF